MNLIARTPRIELILQPHELLSLNNRGQPVTVSCKNGTVWITCEGESGDHILDTGRRFIPKAKGSIVIEAIGAACVNIEENLN